MASLARRRRHRVNADNEERRDRSAATVVTVMLAAFVVLLLVVSASLAQPAEDLTQHDAGLVRQDVSSAQPDAALEQSDDVTSSAPGDDNGDLVAGLRLLEDVRDNVFSFDDPAFYWFCRYVRECNNTAISEIGETERAVPWKFLLERPSDYRGRPVVIEGVLLSRTAFEPTNREGVGLLHQCELGEVGTQSLCAIICIDDPDDIPIRSRIRVKGYFIKIRGYQTNKGDSGAGPLLVARKLETVRVPATDFEKWGLGGRGYRCWIVIITVFGVVVWIVFRRKVRRATGGQVGTSGIRTGAFGRRVGQIPSSDDGPPSDEEFAWLTEDQSGNQCDETAEGTEDESYRRK